MELVKNQQIDTVEQRICQHFADQDAFGHHQQTGCGTLFLLESDLITHCLTNRFTELLRQITCNTFGSKPARFQHDDFFISKSRMLQQKQRQICRFAGTGWRGQDHGGLLFQLQHQLGQNIGNRQGCGRERRHGSPCQ